MPAFLSDTISILDQHTGNIEKSLALLDLEKIWQKPLPHMNSVGHLCLHLAGNEANYIACGLGSYDYVRQRNFEFTCSEKFDSSYLISKLHGSRVWTKEIFAKLDEKELSQPYTHGDMDGCSKRQLILHVLEHYAFHSGQILLLSKLLHTEKIQLLNWSH